MMVVGTASHVGKSWMTTAICRYLRRRGVRVAPFKAQNMSLNSHPCAGGGEIGRAQVAQAEACGLAPTADMNPILLKPTSPGGSQVVVNGKVWKNLSASAYYEQDDFLLEQVLAAFRRLSEEFEFVVMEGAGSAAEINLRSRDLVNLPLAARLDAPALLVADIDRGGVFASVVGTMALLEGEEKKLVRSFAVNRFRGNPLLFNGGREMLEERAERLCLGVFPFAGGISLDAEDSVTLEGRPKRAAGGNDLKIAIVRLPHISNFTDFRLLPDAEYITQPTRSALDCIILPGSKNTIEDLLWLRRQGLERWILERGADGVAVWGICGGYQMLGRTIRDPHGVESDAKAIDGLGLLPVDTTLLATKTTRVVAGSTPRGASFQAYEIRMGETTPSAGDPPFALVDGRAEGFRHGNVVGTYVHGALECPEALSELLAELAQRRGKTAPGLFAVVSKEAEYDRLADWFEQHADLKRFEDLYLT